MGVKISELVEKATANSSDVIPIVDTGTKKITKANLLKEVTNSIETINTKLTNLSTYSTEEVKTGETWIDGKPIYRKVITGTLNKAGSSFIASLSTLNYETIIKLDVVVQNTDPITSQFYSDTTSNVRCYIIPSSKSLKIDIGSRYPTVPLDYVIILEYTKTTD